MNKETTLDYSAMQSVELKEELNQTDITNGPKYVSKVVIIGQHIKALENLRLNKEFCKICLAELKSIMHAKTHYKCTNHLRQVELFREKLLVFPIETAVTILWQLESYKIESFEFLQEVDSCCKVCNVDVVVSSLVDNHYNSEVHKRNLKRYCNICEERTTSIEALAEHRFFSHQLKSQQLSSDGDGVSIHQGYVSQNISPKISPKIENDTRIDFRHNVVTHNCDVCNESFVTAKLFSSHKQYFPHSAMEQLRIRYTSEIVDTFCSVSQGSGIFCALCDAMLRSLVDVENHFNNKKHVGRFEQMCQKLFVEGNVINRAENNIGAEIYNENQTTSTECAIAGTAEIKTVEETPTESKENNFFYCYVCELEFHTKMEVNAHALSFPHVELARLKSEVVSLGIPYERYWISRGTQICCTLCNAKLSSAYCSKQHCSSRKHKKLLLRWCRKVSTSTLKWKSAADPKYFYCKPCDLALVGTTEAEFHYKTKLHLRKNEFSICNVPNSTIEPFEEHQRSLRHQENVLKEGERTISFKTYINSIISDSQKTFNDMYKLLQANNSPQRSVKRKVGGDAMTSETHVDTKTDIKFRLLEDNNSSQHSSDKSLKQQLYTELRKLVDMLYYSDSIPYSVSVEYLKKVNQEIVELRQKYEERPERSGKSTDSSSEHTNYNRRFGVATAKEQLFGEMDDQSTCSSNEQVPLVDIPSVSNNVEFPAEPKTAKKKYRLKSVVNETSPTEEVLKITIEDGLHKSDENEDFQEANEDKRDGLWGEQELEFKYSGNLNDLLEKIKCSINLIRSGWGAWDKQDVEVALLIEIEVLLELIDSGDIPPDIVLSYLQDCNKVLEGAVGKDKRSNKKEDSSVG